MSQSDREWAQELAEQMALYITVSGDNYTKVIGFAVEQARNAILAALAKRDEERIPKNRCPHYYKLGWGEYAGCILPRAHEGTHRMCDCRGYGRTEWNNGDQSDRIDDDPEQETQTHAKE